MITLFKAQARLNALSLLAVVVLSSCGGGGGGGGGGGNKEVVVPGPQGRVTATNEAYTYCDFANGSFTCFSRNPMNMQTCQTTARPYSDVLTLCLSIQQMQNDMNQFNQCNATAALNQIYAQQNCQQVILNGQNGGTVNPINPIINNGNMKTLTCEFEAFRVQQGRVFRREARTPKMTAQITFDGKSPTEIDLRSRFLMFDIGHFGRTTMRFAPAGLRQTADTVTLTNRGLNKSMTIAQTGFAGQPVQLEVLSDDGDMKLAVSCQSSSVFTKNIANKNFSKYVCRGKSNLYGYNSENVDVAFAYNTSLLNTELNIAGGLSAVVTGDTGGADNAKITFTAYGVGSNLSMTSSSYLKTATALQATDGYAQLDIKCNPM